MITQARLIALHRALRDTRVLSIYIDRSAADPAGRRTWRVQLDHSLDVLRQQLSASSPERAEFEACVHDLEDLLRHADHSGTPGWMAFVSRNGVHETHALPVAAPTLAVWTTGPSIAPYVRVLKEERPVILVSADARKASIYRYRFGAVERIDTVRAYHSVEHPLHMAAPPRLGFHSGTRGSTGHDAAQRGLLEGRDRMIAEAVKRVRDLAGSDAWILIGGIPRVVARLTEELLTLAPGRVLRLDSLDIHASDADIIAIARAGASALRNTTDRGRIETIVELAGARGLGAVGPEDARLALDSTCVRELYLTSHYRESHIAEAETAVRAAVDQDAVVEEVSGQAAEYLALQGGMAASLRFRPVTIQTSTLI